MADQQSLKDRLRPDAHDRLDVGFALVLSVLGVVGFRTTFAGGEELVVGVPAVVLGIAVGFVAAKLRPPLLVGVAAAVGVFFVMAGPLALRHHAIAGFLPGPDVFVGLSDGLVNGWKELLTTLPPAGQAGDLLTIPYTCGFVSGAIVVVLAGRLQRFHLCIAPPIVLLATSVLFGTQRPASLLLQGAVFAAATIAWVAMRDRRNREIIATKLPTQRLVMAVGLVALAAIGGVFVGPRLPGADANERFVLRDEVEPPFDPLSEPSPLTAFRNYTDEDHRDDEIITAKGLPDGARLRIGVMDDYDGLVWRSTGSGSVLAGEFLRVGSEIPTDGLGARSTVEVEILRPHGVWVPLAGDLSELEFDGPRADELNDEVRVSLQTDSAAVPRELEAGDRYTFTAEFPSIPDAATLAELPLDGRFNSEPNGSLESDFTTFASEKAGSSSSPFTEIDGIAEFLRTGGAYSDGGAEANPKSPPGHSVRRLLQFLETEVPFGNGEQFAAALGVLADARGIPARVVMGFVNDTGADDVTFVGADIQAWVEVPVEGVGWVPIDATPPEDQLPPPLVKPFSPQENPEPQPPPPTTIPPPATIPDELESEPEEEPDTDADDGGGLVGTILTVLAYAAIPVVLLVLPGAIVVMLKSRRRQQRRSTGSPSDRVAGSFREFIDLARDAGNPVPPIATRSEISIVIGAPSGPSLAERADLAVFDVGEPTDEQVEDAWRAFDTARQEVVGDLPLAAKVRTAVSLTSLRAQR